jgi:hypothetical protein
MNMKFITILFAIAALPFAHAAGITEAQVFEWWDDGTIEAAEANELLSLLDEGNTQEACALAEIYASEPCEMKLADDSADDASASKTSATRKPAGRKRTPKAQKNYGGHFSAKARFDSTGRIDTHRKELVFSFHRATLRLGTQELLSYKSAHGEAHFGQISTRELRNAIPTDTLWGTALAYSFGVPSHGTLDLGGLVDTSGTSRAHVGYTHGKDFTAGAALWKAADTYSVMAQAAFPAGQIAYWHQIGEIAPLIKFQLHGRDSATVSWRTTGYLHGDSIPPHARLSTSILKNRFWTTQNLTFRARELLDTRVSTSARVLSPLHSDSISGRLALDIESGPPAIRGSAKITCREASEDCKQTIYQGTLQSTFDFGVFRATFAGGARTEHDRTEATWKRPRLEIGATVSENLPGKRENLFRLSLVTPDSHPLENTQVRTEMRLTGDHLSLSLIATFKNGGDSKFRPAHAQLFSKIVF